MSVGVGLASGFLLEPEQSTSAIMVHHPAAGLPSRQTEIRGTVSTHVSKSEAVKKWAVPSGLGWSFPLSQR
jgi:hypothetical protein